MASYRVTNLTCSMDWGPHEAEDPDAALDVFAQSRGYADMAEYLEKEGGRRSDYAAAEET